MRLILLLLPLSLCAVAAFAEAPSGEIKEAIAYLERRVPAFSDRSRSWPELLPRVAAALKQHPVYSRWLIEDEAKAAAVARRAASEPRPTFSCRLDKSPSPPTSVHKLRPGDVNVVAAMGDSLTAANGVLATSVVGLLVQYRGLAWSIGGQVPLKDHSTLPNVLRSSNRNLYGFSTGNGDDDSPISGLNVAQPGRKAVDMPGQAVKLVERMRADPKVNMQKDWKIITLFIGGNDICDYCIKKSERSPAAYIKHIRTALDYLHANVPRAFVNVAEVLDVSLVKELKDGSRTCRVLTGSMLCKCAAFPKDDAEEKEVFETIREYQRQLRRLVSSGRYDTRDDFTVVNQPFFRNSKPDRINGKYDLSLFAPDCFHLSLKGHEQAGRALWNNMLEPVGKKATRWDPKAPFSCPTSSRPYLMTSKNS